MISSYVPSGMRRGIACCETIFQNEIFFTATMISFVKKKIPKIFWNDAMSSPPALQESPGSQMRLHRAGSCCAGSHDNGKIEPGCPIHIAVGRPGLFRWSSKVIIPMVRTGNIRTTGKREFEES
jgi:hypothetical protein